jgi:hypothetical protein
MIKLMKFCAAVGLIGVCTGGAFAQEDRTEAAQAAVKDMARETVECAVYFDIVAAVLLGAQERATSQKYVDAHKMAIARADSLSPGVVKAQYDAMVKEMTNKIATANIPRKIEKDLSNVSMLEISVLQNQYGRLCKEVLNEPGQRAKYWMQQVGTPSP